MAIKEPKGKKTKREIGRCTFCGSTIVVKGGKWECLMCRQAGKNNFRSIQ